MKAMGCPTGVLTARMSFYGSMKKRLKLDGSFSDFMELSNGFDQGDAWSIDEVQALMAVWISSQFEVALRFPPTPFLMTAQGLP